MGPHSICYCCERARIDRGLLVRKSRGVRAGADVAKREAAFVLPLSEQMWPSAKLPLSCLCPEELGPQVLTALEIHDDLLHMDGMGWKPDWQQVDDVR